MDLGHGAGLVFLPPMPDDARLPPAACRLPPTGWDRTSGSTPKPLPHDRSDAGCGLQAVGTAPGASGRRIGSAGMGGLTGSQVDALG